MTLNTTAVQDAAVLWKCGENCTAQQAKDFATVELLSRINDWVREHEESKFTKQDVRELWKSADDTARCNAVTALGGSC